MNKQSGFSLIEIMVVVVILGILASIVVIIYFLTKIKGMLANINNPIPA